ncbi:hypothetical protein FORC098_3822 [Salmonella enterica subsp. enterica serovar Typhimurium]|nr:hypothetical protein FORC098_3822 [Salmonella enterica subsp. enterica serovar Typhimurium]
MFSPVIGGVIVVNPHTGFIVPLMLNLSAASGNREISPAETDIFKNESPPIFTVN